MLSKPGWVFDRDREWAALAAHLESARPVPTLGLVTGRRRQGKTFLLAALAQAGDGFYFGADEATGAESLRRFSDVLAQHSGTPVRFGTWDDAIAFLFSLAAGRPVPLIIDEFPMLMRAEPALPSILQRQLDARQLPTANQGLARLLLCGSAMAVMSGLLAGGAPLRGRAGLELMLRPLGFRDAARFWEVSDPRTAIMLHAIVGGTPAYRDQFAGADTPAGPADFDAWVCRTVLNPFTPLFREARYLLAEEVSAREPGLFHSVLGAIANGNSTNGGIATYVGRRSSDIAHPLTVLEDVGLVSRDPDLFRKGRSAYRIAEPLISFYQAIMRPQWAALELGGAERVWRDSSARFFSGVVGPHFEQICRDWLATADGVLAEPAALVGSGVIPGGRPGGQVQVDVAALSPGWPGERSRVLSLGEAKWGKRLGLRHLDRLARARDMLAQRGLDTDPTTLALYSGTGFDDDLVAVARQRPDVLLVDPARLYS